MKLRRSGLFLAFTCCIAQPVLAAETPTVTIEHVRLIDYRIGRTKAFVTSKGTSDSCYGIFVRITARTSDGKTLVALGDALPRGSVTNETLADAWTGATAMAAALKGRVLDGEDVYADRAKISEWMGDLDRIAAGQKLTTRKPPTADKQLRATLCGFDIALLDLVGRKHQMPIYRVLSDGPREMVSISAITVNADADADDLADQAGAAAAYGAVRVKIGLSDEQDVAKIASVAREFAEKGQPTDIWVDVNQAWKTSEKSLAMLGKIRDALAAVHYKARFICEQPTDEGDLAALAAVTKVTREWNVGSTFQIITMADEAVWTLADARKMVALDAADYVNIKIQKSGGLLAAMAIGDYLAAEAPNVGVYVGGVVATDITAWANLQLCFALPRLDFATGCIPRRAYPINPAATPLAYSKTIKNSAKSFEKPTGTGLGTALNEQALQPYIRRDTTN